MDSLSKVPDSVMRGTNNNKQTPRFRFFPRVAEAFVPEFTEATFGCVAHAWKTEMCRFALGSGQKYADFLLEVLLRARKTGRKKVSPKFPKENIASAKLQAE